MVKKEVSSKEETSKTYVQYILVFNYSADKVSIAIGVIDSCHVREILILDIRFERESGFFAREREVPVVSHKHFGGIRSVSDDIVVLGGFTIFDILYFLSNFNHGVNEAVEFGERFAFSRFDHQCLMNRECHCWGVEAIVHQSFCDVDGGDACCASDLIDVENHFVCHVAVIACIEYWVVVFQSVFQVVSVKYSTHCSFLKAFTAQHLDIAVGDSEDLCATERSC